MKTIDYKELGNRYRKNYDDVCLSSLQLPGYLSKSRQPSSYDDLSEVIPVMKDGEWFYVTVADDGVGKKVSKGTYGWLGPRNIEGYSLFSPKGSDRIGVMNADEEITIEPSAATLEWLSGFLVCKWGEVALNGQFKHYKTAVYTSDGKLLEDYSNVVYASARYFRNNTKYAVAPKGDKAFMIRTEYDKKNSWKRSFCLFRRSTADAHTVIDLMADIFFGMDIEPVSVLGSHFVCIDKQGMWGALDEKGNNLIPFADGRIIEGDNPDNWVVRQIEP